MGGQRNTELEGVMEPLPRSDTVRREYSSSGALLLSDPERAVIAAETLKALAHPLRLKMVALLCQRDAHVNELAGIMGVEQSLISQHLRVLRMSRLVTATRGGGHATYHLAQEWLHELVHCMSTVPFS